MSDTTAAQRDAGADGESLQDLVRRAEAGDQSALPALRHFLDENEQVWRRTGDLGLQAEASLVSLAAGGNLVLAESIGRKVRALKEELAGPAPSLLERLLVDRVALTWLQASYFDALGAQAGEVSTAQAGELRRRQDAAANRFLAAVRALTLLRRHLRPAGGRHEKGGSGKVPLPAEVPLPAHFSDCVSDTEGGSEEHGEASQTVRRTGLP